MMDLSDAIKRMKYDKRLLDWNIKNEVITEKELEKHLKSLSDLKKEAESFKLNEHDSG